MPDAALRKRAFEEAWRVCNDITSLLVAVDAVSKKIEALPAEPGTPPFRVQRYAHRHTPKKPYTHAAVHMM
jgi:hypothetical protein